jgi:hypothetical protein
MTVKAPSREQAEEIHKAKREPITSAEPGKVEAEKENNND